MIVDLAQRTGREGGSAWRLRSLLASVQLALDTVRQHKMRAFLTVLGVIIGTGTIMGVGSIMAGLDGAITSILRSFGTDTVIVFKFPMGPRMGNLSAEERQRKPLTLENAIAIAERCPSVRHVSPYLFPPRAFGPNVNKVRYQGNDLFSINLGGTEPGYAEGGQAEMLFGRFFSDGENRHRVPVTVIGEDVYKALLSGRDPLGKSIDVNGHQFEVIGVMKRPANSFPGQQDLRVLLPYFTMRKFYPKADEHMLVVVAHEGRMAAAMDEVRAVLRMERRVPLSAPDNFAMSTAEQMVEQFRSITAMTALVMVVMSSIGLLVGGIGVMNIMLVSVTERTREIGIRKAIGARRIDIVVQFLTEAVVLTGIGGLLGMLFGYLVSLGARLAFPELPTSVPLWAAAAGVLMSVAVGLFFGLWPANKAARLDPVDALRYE
ncbi:MAG: ABC transporter permease [Bryobacteraceae bacterium]|nr:ABC transporter permease [Bryobacteraceae bacterium]